MKKSKLNCVLLIDDNESTNFLHRIVIEKSNCADTIVETNGANKALDFLKAKINGKYPNPELIFLDINMPGLNGWDFIEEYEKLNDDQIGRQIIIMLTTSLHPVDMSMAKSLKQVNGYQLKPLTTEKLEDILEQHFPEIQNYKSEGIVK